MHDDYRVIPGPTGPAPVPSGFLFRVSENFFKRWPLFLLPILLMGALGVRSAQGVTASYESSAVLSATANVFVGEPEIRGTERSAFETAAQGTARSINEQLFTDAFIETVAARAGLDGAIDDGLLDFDDVRAGVGADPTGDTLLAVTATWDDAETAFLLADSAVASYQTLLEDILVEDAEAAVLFYEERLAEEQARALAARTEYDSFVAQLPVLAEGVDLPLTEELQLTKLDENLTRAEAAIDDAEGEIEGANLAVVQARSDAGQGLRVVDSPTVPLEAESTTIAKLTLLVVFLGLGGLISATILAAVAYLDQSVRSSRDVVMAGGGVTLALIPRVRSLLPQRRFLPGRRSAPATVATAPFSGELWPEPGVFVDDQPATSEPSPTAVFTERIESRIQGSVIGESERSRGA